MTGLGSTVADVFADKLRSAHDARLKLSPNAMADLKLPGVDPKVVQNHLIDSLHDLLDIGLGDILLGAWSKLRELEQFRGASGGRGEVDLAEHTIDANYRPTLVVQVDQRSVGSIELDLRLRIDVHALTLQVDSGKIRDITPADFQIEVVLLCKEQEILEPLHSDRIPLTDYVHLGEGIPIP